MLQKLLLRPQLPSPEHAAPVFDWVLIDLNGDILKSGTGQELDTIDQMLMQNGLEHIVTCCLWPASACLATSAMVPGRPSRINAQMLAFAVEEQLAQDIEAVHIVQGGQDGHGGFHVRCIDRNEFQRVYDLLTRDGWCFQLREMYLDADLLPLGEHSMLVLMDHGHVLIREKAGQKAVSCRIGNLERVLTLLVAPPAESATDADAPKAEAVRTVDILMTGDEASLVQVDLLIAQLTQTPGVSVQKEPIGWSEMEYLASCWLQKKHVPMNLCQGEFKLQTETNTIWQKWKPLAAVAAVGFVLQLGVFIAKGYHYQQQALGVEQQAVTEYQNLVPGGGNIDIDKLPRIIKGKLNQSGEKSAVATDFLSLLGETGNQYQQSADKAQVRFTTVSYNEQRGELTIELMAQSFEQLDRLKQAIDGAGLVAKISSAVQEENLFRGRISVSGS